MNEKTENPSPVTGKTYSLFDDEAGTEKYYKTIRTLTDSFLSEYPDEKKLLALVQNAAKKKHFTLKHQTEKIDHIFTSYVKKSLKEFLSSYTRNVKKHLKTVSISQNFDPVLKTNEEQYHLYMIEIELVNRIYIKAFRKSEYKFALIGHCLRDFRPDCCSVSGDIEAVCMGCTEDCFINLGSQLLKKYNIHPYISVEMDLEKLFRKIKREHPDSGALGIACVPELANGMRLCIKTGIIPVGIPLNANRCARWMKVAHESSFSLKELEDLLTLK